MPINQKNNQNINSIEKLIQPDFLFSKQQDESVDFEEKDLIELKPYGLSLANDTTRPFLILKDDAGLFTLPVGISQIEAGVALTQSSSTLVPSTPHKFSEMLLNSLDIKIERCVFIEIKGLHQYVRIYMTGHLKYQSLKLKADEAMSLCIYLKIPIYATQSFIQKSKVMTAEVSELSKMQTGRPEFLMGKNNLCH
jgi:bifunctional DNase/RNase